MAADIWLEKDRWCSADVYVFCGGGERERLQMVVWEGGQVVVGREKWGEKKKNRNKRIFEFKFKVKSHMSSMACVLQMVYVIYVSYIASATREIVLDFKLFFSLCYFTIFFVVIKTKKKLLSFQWIYKNWRKSPNIDKKKGLDFLLYLTKQGLKYKFWNYLK